MVISQPTPRPHLVCRSNFIDGSVSKFVHCKRTEMTMKSVSKAALAAAGIAIAGTLAGPAVASADPYPPRIPSDWHHPEWAGWNDGYPVRGWAPPAGWAPPRDWNNPGGWKAPPEWCGGPIRILIHPFNCW